MSHQYVCGGRYTQVRVVEATTHDEAQYAYETSENGHAGWAWCREALPHETCITEITSDGRRTRDYSYGSSYGASSPDLGY
jgi:hypothetical protein